jgi:hypothetical protein
MAGPGAIVFRGRGRRLDGVAQHLLMSGHPEYDTLPVSLEPHLAETLRSLVDVVPAPLSAELSPLLSVTKTTSSSTPTIPYALLRSIARWARTEEGAKALKAKDPPLDPLAYSMVTLLAGTRTSPDKKFPQSSHSSSARSENAAREISDRRAIVAVLNSLLSVICTGVATWWAAQRTGWRDEWVGCHRHFFEDERNLCSDARNPESPPVAAHCDNRCSF